MPAEFSRAARAAGAPARQRAVLLCNRCWLEAEVPDIWREALVSAILKNDDSSDYAKKTAFGLFNSASVLVGEQHSPHSSPGA
eukprot:5731387-Pyramimonas_sp.AAC.1